MKSVNSEKSILMDESDKLKYIYIYRINYIENRRYTIIFTRIIIGRHEGIVPHDNYNNIKISDNIKCDCQLTYWLF